MSKIAGMEPSKLNPLYGQQAAAAGNRNSAGDKFFRSLFPKRPQQPLHDRMLLGPKRFGIALGETADEGESGELRLRGEPAFDEIPIRVEL
jgi:hypothetical protein